MSLTIIVSKFVSFLSISFGFGSGATWPGHLALKMDKAILQKLASQFRVGVILVAGTNGKTTTSLMITKLLQENGYSVVHNATGANLLNGIVSSLVRESSLKGKINADIGVFEIDENSLPQFLDKITPLVICFLNLFRDQLDRYGEVASISKKWIKALDTDISPILILNADDPSIYQLRDYTKKYFTFGLGGDVSLVDKLEHSADSIHCSKCRARIVFSKNYFSHLGQWYCPGCGLSHPKESLSLPAYNLNISLPGIYNKYNAAAAILAVKAVDSKINISSLQTFVPAFGRQEVIRYEDRNVRLLLSKNPTGMNESLKTLGEFITNGKALLFVLNDNIPDGRDVSWIWDVDIPQLKEFPHLVATGTRAEDMGLRLKYAFADLERKIHVEEELKKALEIAINHTEKNKDLTILATYSGMLEMRKLLTGNKLL